MNERCQKAKRERMREGQWERERQGDTTEKPDLSGKVKRSSNKGRHS